MLKSIGLGGGSSAAATTQSAGDLVTLGKAAMGLEPNDSCCPSMSYEHRLWGFACSWIAGWVLSFCSVIAMSTGNVRSFAILYAAGNVVAMSAMLFLVGPMRQLKSMFASGRIIATVVFLAMIAVTLVVAFQTSNVILVILCIFIQFLAGMWYSLSYIPFARQMVLSVCCPAMAGSGMAGV